MTSAHVIASPHDLVASVLARTKLADADGSANDEAHVSDPEVQAATREVIDALRSNPAILGMLTAGVPDNYCGRVVGTCADCYVWRGARGSAHDPENCPFRASTIRRIEKEICARQLELAAIYANGVKVQEAPSSRGGLYAHLAGRDALDPSKASSRSRVISEMSREQRRRRRR